MIVSLSIAAAGCGDDEPAAVTVPVEPPAAESAPPPGEDATPSTATDAPTAPTGQDTPTSTTQDGSTTIEIGPGAVEAPVIDAEFTIDGARVEPSRITVPAFLTLDIAAVSGDGREHTLRITTPDGPLTLTVPAGGSASNAFDGVPPGEYPVAVDGTVTDARLVVARGAGPDGG